MAKTSISVVKGRGSMNHNNREFSTQNVDQSLTKNNITYKKESLEQAYQKLFQEEVDRYNLGKKPCRQIPDYMEHIRNSKNGEKLFYETVIQVGNKFDCPVGSEMGDKAKAVLDDYMREFQDRNPNLYVFNAVLHLDESTPHLHIDYIPVAHEYQKGLHVRNSLDKALKEQGIDGKANKRENSTRNWQEGEKNRIEEIMRGYGLERSPEKGLQREHMTVDQYKAVAEQVHQEIRVLPKQIETAPVLLNGNKVSVKKDDLAKLEQRAKLSMVHEKSTKELVNDIQKTLDLTQKGYQSIKGKELTLDVQKIEFERFRASETMKIIDLKQHLQEQIKKQSTLNQSYHELVEKYNGVVKQHNDVVDENRTLKLQIADLKQQIDERVKQAVEPLKNQIESLKERLQGFAQTITNITKAVGMFKYDKGNFKVALTKEQGELVDAITEYSKVWIERDGKSDVNVEELKADIDSNVGISKGIRNYMTPDYKEIVYYKGEQGRGWYGIKTEGNQYLGCKDDTIQIRNRFPNARFKDPHELTNLSMSALNKGIIKKDLGREL